MASPRLSLLEAGRMVGVPQLNGAQEWVVGLLKLQVDPVWLELQLDRAWKCYRDPDRLSV